MLLSCIPLEDAISLALTLVGIAVAALAIPPFVAEVRFGRKIASIEEAIAKLRVELSEFKRSDAVYSMLKEKIDILEEETSDVRAQYRKTKHAISNAPISK